MNKEDIEDLKREIRLLKAANKELFNINKDLQQRIDKAIEYIKEHNIIGMNKEYLPRGYECCYSGELMEILKGCE